jgi:hypothetical protein
MQTAGHMGWEASFIDAVRTNLNVLIPTVTLIFKILVKVVSRDEMKEVMRSITNLPLELMLISTSFMLGALSGISSSYANRFHDQSGAGLFAVVAIAVIFAVSVVVNRLDEGVRVLFGKTFVAMKQYHELSQQPVLPGAEPSMAKLGRFIWAMVYCILFVLLLVCSFGISVGTLAYVLHLIQ